MLIAVVLGVVSYAICYYSAPAAAQARGMADLGVEYRPTTIAIGRAETPGEWLECSPLLTIFIGACGLVYLTREIADKGPAVLLDLNHFVFAFLIAGLLLHWRPRSFGQAISAGVPSVAGVLIQYPLYAGMVKMMTESGLAKRLAEIFIDISTAHTFPLLVGIYSAFLGLFIPSAGGKWLVEAPYMLTAATSLHVHLGWVVQTYNATEALANLIHPFLDVAAPRHSRPEGARHRRLFDAAVRHPRADSCSSWCGSSTTRCRTCHQSFLDRSSMSAPSPESTTVPRWARVADSVCILLVVLAAIVAASGGFRVRLGSLRIGVTSPYPLLAWALIVGIVRHVAWPREPIYADVPRRIRSWWACRRSGPRQRSSPAHGR